MKKSLTQMTKQELMEVIREKEKQIAGLHVRIDELEGLAIVSAAAPLDAKSSDIIRLLRQRIQELEGLNGED